MRKPPTRRVRQRALDEEPGEPTESRGARHPGLLEGAENALVARWRESACHGRSLQRDEDAAAGEGSVSTTVDADPAEGGAAPEAFEVPAGGEDKYVEIEKLLVALDDQWFWSSPVTLSNIRMIWESFGSDLANAANNRPDLWKRSVAAGVEIGLIPEVQRLGMHFAGEVTSTARDLLEDNLAVVEEHEAQLGLGGADVDIGLSPERQDLIHEMQLYAEQIAGLEKMQDALLEIRVGTELRPNPRAPELETEHPVYFSPTSRPQVGPRGHEKFPTWEETNEQYTAVATAIGAFASEFPALYAIVRDGRAEEFSQAMGFVRPLAMLEESLGGLKDNIIRALTYLVESPDLLSWHDLKPLHEDFYAGRQGSEVSWSLPFEQSVAKSAVEEKEDWEWWSQFGVSTLSAAAFAFASFTTGGAAVMWFAIGAAAGGAAVENSWEDLKGLQSGYESQIEEGQAFVNEGQVNQAYLTAVLDSVFLFLDLFGPAIGLGIDFFANRALRTAGDAGSEAAKFAALGRFDPLADDAALTLQDAVAGLGVEQTLAKTGRSADELAKVPGLDPKIKGRLLAFEPGALGGIDELMEGVATLADDIAGGVRSVSEADALVAQAIERAGPAKVLKTAGGWKKLHATLGEGEAGKLLLSYRTGVVEDLEVWALQALKTDGEDAFKVTGSGGKFANDLDISFLGPHAAENRQKALAFLSGRTGVDPDDFGKMLYSDLFTDPTRLHLYDHLPPEIRERIAADMARFDAEVVYAKRVNDAWHNGDDAAMEAITAERDALGIAEVPFRYMDEAGLAAEYRLLDKKHQDLQRIFDETGSYPEDLTKDIAQRQAWINANEGGGYASGGGGRKFVSERDKFPGFDPGRLKEVEQMLDSQRLTAILSNRRMLDEAQLKLAKAVADGKTAEELSAALKGVAKYAGRMTEVLGDVGKGVPDLGLWNGMTKAFDDIVRRAKLTPDDPARLAADIKGWQRWSTQLIDEFEAAQFEIFQYMIRRANLPDVVEGLEQAEIVVKWYSGLRIDWVDTAIKLRLFVGDVVYALLPGESHTQDGPSN